MCSLGALHKPCSLLKPYFGNRALEVSRLRELLKTFTDDLAPVAHIPGEDNPADLGTRGLVDVADLGKGSVWQLGAGFLQTEYETWPRTSIEDVNQATLPVEECRSLFGTTAAVTVQGTNNPVQRLLDEVSTQSKLGGIVRNLGLQSLTREKLEMSVRAFARVIQAVVTGNRESCRREPSVRLVEVAVRVLLHGAAMSARKALKDGKLRGLGAEDRGSIVWVTGRIRGEQLAILLGTEALPVILQDEPLAKAIMRKAHREDHRRGPRDAAARSRKYAWIVSATKLAKTVIGKCFYCRHKDRRLEEQIMGRLPPERLEVIAPFEATALDLFGPFWVKDAAKGRRRFKCWVVSYVCMGAKAVCMLPCPGYGTAEFLTTHRFFTGLYGRPKVVYTDHAPSLIKAAETPDWAEIGAKVGEQGTEWRLTAKGCSWRNGLAERVIRAARHSLSHELRLGETLDFHQFGSVLAVISAILNARPLSVRVSADGEYHALAPRDVLFGRASRSLNSTTRAIDFALDLDQDSVLASMCDQQAKIVEAWRAKWKEAVFPDMVARPKWRSAVRNLQPGDIGHVRYQKAVGQHEWRLAMVETAEPDDDGTVRTVVVAFRPRHKKDTGKPYVSKTAQRLEIGVQRFAVLMAQDEMKTVELQDQLDPRSSEMTEN